eukprot:75650_1
MCSSSFIPTVIYGLCLFDQYRDNDIMSQRNPFVVYWINGLVITALLTERILVLLSRIYEVVVFLMLIKVYYVYFQQQYSLSIANKVWTESDNTSWYIDHKHTFLYLVKIWEKETLLK